MLILNKTGDDNYFPNDSIFLVTWTGAHLQRIVHNDYQIVFL